MEEATDLLKSFSENRTSTRKDKRKHVNTEDDEEDDKEITRTTSKPKITIGDKDDEESMRSNEDDQQTGQIPMEGGKRKQKRISKNTKRRVNIKKYHIKSPKNLKKQTYRKNKLKKIKKISKKNNNL